MPDVVTEQLPAASLPSGVELASEVSRTAASRGAPPVVFLHGTTFSRGVWRPVARGLADLAAGIAVDLRGHGDSSNPEPPYHWSLFADDIVAYVGQLPPGQIVLCGHSLGGATAAEVAARIPERIAALVLIEPVLAPHGVAPSDGLIEATLRRRRSWPDQAQAEEHFAARSPWRYWDREVLAGFFATGLALAEDGECTLSSPPEVAASVYAEALGSQAWSRLPDITCPVWVLRGGGDQGGRPSTASPLIAQTVPNGTDRLIEGPSGHFLPMDQPQLIAEFIREILTGRPGLGLLFLAELAGKDDLIAVWIVQRQNPRRSGILRATWAMPTRSSWRIRWSRSDSSRTIAERPARPGSAQICTPKASARCHSARPSIGRASGSARTAVCTRPRPGRGP